MESVTKATPTSSSSSSNDDDFVVFHQPQEFNRRVLRRTTTVRGDENLKRRLKAISLNNRGVTLLERRHYHSAIDHLFEALRMCHKAILKEEEEEEQGTASHHHQSGCEDVTAAAGDRGRTTPSIKKSNRIQTNDVLLEDLMVKPNTSESRCNSGNHTIVGAASPCFCSNEGEVGYMYQHPIFIPPSSTTRPMMIPSNTCLADIVIFNLALTTHLCALEGTHKNPEEKMYELDRAISLYNMAYDLQLSKQQQQSSGTVSSSSSSSPTSILFVAAVVNNLSLAYESLGNMYSSHKCCEYLLSIMMCHMIYRQDNDQYESIDDVIRRQMNIESARQLTSRFSSQQQPLLRR